MIDIDLPLNEDWLKRNGFKWHQFDRQPHKHWLLWLSVINGGMMLDDDLGIEVTRGHDDWFCWLRSDSAGRYHRFIHLRHIETPRDLVEIISGITGISFDSRLCLYGHFHTPESMERLLASDSRLDRQLIKDFPWYGEFEKDEFRGRPLIDHVRAYEEARKGMDK